MPSKVRLYVDQPLAQGQTVPLAREQANYLFNVMRLTPGTVLSLFNSRDGEWDAAVAHAGKHAGSLTVTARTRPLQPPPDLWLVFAPLKKTRTDFTVEKAVELGVSRILPVQTDFTNAERVRGDKMTAHAVEAAEQCGATFVPEVAEVQRLSTLLDRWPEGRSLWFCDESRVSETAAPQPTAPAPAAILIGPEGGFSETERTRLGRLSFAQPIRLGPRILRAETAAVAALSLWQITHGDWR
ncbi:MAG: 16S rRNA (uracil(1498)-N(3))-methyltransferase [Rhodobacterales bacterium]|nr:16S rRNA (uracil(1498)-N(3))-methyltransferase [Rhodobacterales bacterium]